MSRMTVAIDRDIGNRIHRLAHKLGMTVFSLTNQMLTQTIKVFEESDAKIDIYELWQREKAKKELGLVLVSEKTLAQTEKICLRYERETTYKLWKKWGSETALYLKRYYESLKYVCEAIKVIFSSLEEIYLEESREGTILHVSLPSALADISELILAWYEGFVEGYGYEVVKSDIIGSTFRFLLRKRRM
jgi:hypothetical protein